MAPVGFRRFETMPSTSPSRSNRRRSLELGLLLATLLSVVVLPADTQADRSGTLAPRAHAAIIGGAPAEVGTFPSLAYIVNFQGRVAYQCTGTVVAPSLILTAGHCAENMKTGVANRPSGYRVVTGTVNPLSSSPTVSRVIGVIVYPGLVRKLDDGDAALLVLSAPLTTPPIVLATGSPSSSSRAGLIEAGAQATIVGWGKTSFRQRTSTQTLQSAATVVQGRRWCRRNARPFYEKGEICAISPPSYATGGCQGDSGGPLLVPGSIAGELVQIGIAVHVYGRCSTRRPTVFTSIRSIAPWVRTWIDAYRPSRPLPASPTSPAPSPPTPPAP